MTSTFGAFVPLLTAFLVVGFLAGIATGILPSRAQLAVCGLGSLAVGMLLALPSAAWWLGKPCAMPLDDAFQLFLRLLTAFGAVAALAAGVWRIFRMKEALDLHSEWGALGQGMGGWRMSPAAGLLLLGVLLAALALMTGTGRVGSGGCAAEKAQTAADTSS